MEKNILDFIQQNSPDGGFLQSVYWRKFQESVGRRAYDISEKGENGDLVAHANIITHKLPVVGDYFYIPRGPIQVKSEKLKVKGCSSKLKVFLNDLISLAKKNNAGWIRIEPNGDEELNLIKESLLNNFKIKKSAVDMQPREILVIDISKSEEEILAKMKQKTRYNIKLAEKRGVKVSVISGQETVGNKYLGEFLRLVHITSKRDEISSHPDNYYRKMFGMIPNNILKLYIAEYKGKIIAANLVLLFGRTATYMHGASDNEHRSVMAPYLLQWQQILDAKKAGCERYDFGGVKTENTDGKSWEGVTKFKAGFAPDVRPIQFPGCYDIILKPAKYNLYRFLQKIKRIL
ncbi:MAG: peptidoglycan bridge formation glycyltransferase FemA/FemB family protein [Candidatus Moranbacteria bacterium]|nr:peptidoglycan bridge formation glycyltransferase FemA/FemB family protein [Candidatus Moranbacteria bacterium]